MDLRGLLNSKEMGRWGEKKRERRRGKRRGGDEMDPE